MMKAKWCLTRNDGFELTYQASEKILYVDRRKVIHDLMDHDQAIWPVSESYPVTQKATV